MADAAVRVGHGAHSPDRELAAPLQREPAAQRTGGATLMASTAADILIETIRDWGVEVIFGLPGDGINGIVEALRKRRSEIRFIQVRHEEAAAFMACGY